MNRIIHTDAPLIPLTQMIGGTATIFVDTAAAGTRNACFYGWGEAMDAPFCKPHHLVATQDETSLLAIAEALVDTGHQVVITDYDVWAENQQVLNCDDHHQH